MKEMRNMPKKAQISVVIALLAVTIIAVHSPPVQATMVRYSDLGHYEFDNMASSLKVRGTAIVYNLKNCDSSQGVYYFSQDTDMPDLRTIGWNDMISSLQIDGSITLYEHVDYGGRTVTFVSTNDPNENLGNCWNSNPNLTRTEGGWDSKVWGWAPGYTQLMETDADNYVNWTSDGSVSSGCKDSISRSMYGASNFDQGYKWDMRWIPDLAASHQTDSSTFGNYVLSIKLLGTVTLFENTSYTGVNITLGPFNNMDGWIPDLRNAPYGWNHTVRSLHLFGGGTVTLYKLPNYAQSPQGRQLNFVAPSFQPSPLRIGDAATMTLEGSVSDWYTDSLGIGSCSWTGVKFDVFAVEDPTRAPEGRNIMLELYFLRQGMNLWWGSATSMKQLNKMVAIDCFPESVQRTVHPGDIQRWKIDLKRFLLDCGRDYSVDISNWYVAMISFTVESGSNWPWGESPACRCELHKLRLCWTGYASGVAHVYVDPISIKNASLTPGSVFNVSVKADIPANMGVVGIQFKLIWNASLLNATSMKEVVFHETMPPGEVNANLRQLKHITSEGYVEYNYTYVDTNRALTGGYAPISGDHIVAVVTFEVRDVGECMLHFNTTKLVDQMANAVPNETVDGFFSNLLPSPEVATYAGPSQVNDTLGPGSVFNITVQLDSIAFHSGIMGVQFRLNWDPNILEAEKATEVMFHEITPQSEWDNIWTIGHQINNTGGYFSYAYTFIDPSEAISGGYAPIYGNHTLAIVTFRVKAVGKCMFQLANCTVGDVYASPLYCSVSYGIFNNIIPGDIDGNGWVNLLDAIDLSNLYGLKTGQTSFNPNADFDGNGVVNILDVITLSNHFGQHYP